MKYLIDKYFIKKPRFRRFVTRLIERDKDVEVSLLGSVLKINTIKEHGYLRASRIGTSSSLLQDELPVLLNLASILQQGDTFVDIGANVGIYSVVLARVRAAYPNICFHAFEANPDTYRRLEKNVEKLGVIAHNIALSDREGALDFVSGAVSHVFTTVENANAYSIKTDKMAVKCRRLDSFDLVGDSIVLKIDVEGQERNVLEGSRGLFQAKRIKCVYLDGYKDKGVMEFLARNDFALFDGRTMKPTNAQVFSLMGLRKHSQPNPWQTS